MIKIIYPFFGLSFIALFAVPVGVALLLFAGLRAIVNLRRADPSKKMVEPFVFCGAGMLAFMALLLAINPYYDCTRGACAQMALSDYFAILKGSK